MNKVILVLSDGLRYDVAVAGMGYLGHLVETRAASLYKVISELPSISRPMYETVHTGVRTSEHGIITNNIVRRSVKPNIFQAARQAGKTTAAAAYFWFSELYNHAPYDQIEDREVDDESLLIQHGRFYTQDSFPDIELFDLAVILMRKYSPDYLLVHPMGMDDIGQKYGSNTSEYRNHAIEQGMWMTQLVSEGLEQGYNVIVTADHGMNIDKTHGGTTPDMREVPLFLIRPGMAGAGNTQEVVSQLQIAPTICKLLDVEIPETMKAVPIV
jgi:predicted AlkP superfamily pyrophosphatase or phosphodiesterase